MVFGRLCLVVNWDVNSLHNSSHESIELSRKPLYQPMAATFSVRTNNFHLTAPVTGESPTQYPGVLCARPDLSCRRKFLAGGFAKARGIEYSYSSGKRSFVAAAVWWRISFFMESGRLVAFRTTRTRSAISFVRIFGRLLASLLVVH